MAPLASVVLPVYNGADYIAIALESLLAQGEDVEIVVSDNCSSDNTVEIVRSFGAKNIRLLENREHSGLFVNLNRGLAAASGEYIQMFSHDDVAHPGFIETQINAFSQGENIGLVYASCNMIDGQDNHLGVCDDAHTPAVIDFEKYLWIASRYGSLPPSISCVMISRAAFARIGYFDPDFLVAGDLEYYNRLAEKYRLARNRAVLLDVRTHRGMVSRASSTPLHYLREEIEILKFYRHNLSDAEYKKVMRVRGRSRGVDHAKSLLQMAANGRGGDFFKGYALLSKMHNVPLCMVRAIWQKGSNTMKALAP